MLVTVCVVTMVLSFADEVAETGSTIVLFWKSAWELVEEEPVTAVFKLPVAAVFKDTLDVVASASGLPAVLFWNGASEAIDVDSVTAVFKLPVAAVFKGALGVAASV